MLLRSNFCCESAASSPDFGLGVSFGFSFCRLCSSNLANSSGLNLGSSFFGGSTGNLGFGGGAFDATASASSSSSGLGGGTADCLDAGGFGAGVAVSCGGRGGGADALGFGRLLRYLGISLPWVDLMFQRRWRGRNLLC